VLNVSFVDSDPKLPFKRPGGVGRSPARDRRDA